MWMKVDLTEGQITRILLIKDIGRESCFRELSMHDIDLEYITRRVDFDFVIHNPS